MKATRLSAKEKYLIKVKRKIDNRLRNGDGKNENWFKNMEDEERYNNQFLNNKLDNKDNMNIIKNVNDIYKSQQKFKININNTNTLFNDGVDFKDSMIYQCIDEISIKDNLNFKDSLLYKILKENKRNNFSEYHNINEKNTLTNVSKYSNVYPWEFNLNSITSKFDGECSDSIIYVHFIKFKRLLSSIKKYGYVNHGFKDQISGFFLVDNNKFKFIGTRGTHRLLILKYLNIDVICNFDNNYTQYKKIKKYKKIYDKKNSEDWDIIKSNFINRNIAERIFDFYMI